MQTTPRPQHNGLFSLHTLQEQSLLIRITGPKEDNLRSLVLSFFLNRTSFIMEVLCTQLCATASLYLGRGGCLCLILFSRTSLSFSGVLPIADPPVVNFSSIPAIGLKADKCCAWSYKGEKVLRRIISALHRLSYK
jgi:hypothetical protein